MDVSVWISVGVSVGGKDVVVGAAVGVCEGVLIPDCTLMGVGGSATAHATITIENRNVKGRALNRTDMVAFL